VRLDDKGFVRTGAAILRPLETSLPGVFATGDVCAGSVKRGAAAVGEGAQVGRHCTPFWRKPATKTHFLPISGDSDVR
jgi:thioredoxin reductase